MTGPQVGLYYGRQMRNPPPAALVEEMLREEKYSRIWISEPDNELLKAISHHRFKITLGVPNSTIRDLSSVSAATNWVKNNISAHRAVDFTHVCLGDLSKMSDADREALVPAMKNMHNALRRQNPNIKVSTLADKSSFASPYDIGNSPSKCEFNPTDTFIDIFKFLEKENSPLFIKVMPYFEMDNIPYSVRDVKDDNFLLNRSSKFLTDQDGTEYTYVFDAIVDSFLCAMRNLGFDDLKIVVASGWPRRAGAGDTKATVQNALTYNTNLKQHINNGTPKNKNTALETFIWSVFDEDKLEEADEGWNYLGAFAFKWENLTLR